MKGDVRFDAQRHVDHECLREQADEQHRDPAQGDRQRNEDGPQHRADDRENGNQTDQPSEAVHLDAGQEGERQGERQPARDGRPDDPQQPPWRRFHPAQHHAAEAQPPAQEPADDGQPGPAASGQVRLPRRTGDGARGTGTIRNHIQRRLTGRDAIS